jgi:hypothetical protein
LFFLLLLSHCNISYIYIHVVVIFIIIVFYDSRLVNHVLFIY